MPVRVTPSCTAVPFALAADRVQTVDTYEAILRTTALVQTATASVPTPTITLTLTGTPTPTLTPTDTPTPTITPSPTAAITETAWLTDPPFATETPIEMLIPPVPMLTPLPPPLIISRAGWGAEPPSGAYQTQEPDRITLHHDGVLFTGDAVRRIKTIQRYALHSHGWVDIPYHYLIDLDGNIL